MSAGTDGEFRPGGGWWQGLSCWFAIGLAIITAPHEWRANDLTDSPRFPFVKLEL